MTRMPQVSARDLVRFLKSQGFAEHRQSGSHLTLCFNFSSLKGDVVSPVQAAVFKRFIYR